MKRSYVATSAATVLALGTVALLFAACGGASGPGVASLGSSTTATTSTDAASSNTNKTTDYLDGVKYAQCMRSHGVPSFPDPNSQGNFLYHADEVNGQKVEVHSPQYNSANKACTHLLPNGGQSTPAEMEALVAQALRYVNCLRTHGIPNIPDPTRSNGNVGISFAHTGLSPDSPRLQAAMKACKSLSPGGGP
jgi:hypothetical protein